MVDKITAEFEHLNDTKTKSVFVERGKEVIGSKVYINKDTTESIGSPEAITITITPAA